MRKAQGSRLEAQRRARVLVGHWALSIALCALITSGCAKAQAKGTAGGPPLQVPAPPPRVLAPVEEPVTASAPPPETPVPVAAAPRPPAARPPVRRADPQPETPAPAA